MNTNIEKLFKQYNISLKTSQTDSFEKFLALFIEKNSQINLSAIRDEVGIIEKHFIDSIILNNFIKLHWKVLDIWTWWGFPSLPLAITNEEVEFIWLDSTRKKIDSVNSFIDDLWLANVKWIWGRAEELTKQDELYMQFDFVVSRATAYLPDIINYSFPFLKDWGTMIFYKLYDEAEISDWKKLLKRHWLNKTQIFKYAIGEQERVFIAITI